MKNIEQLRLNSWAVNVQSRTSGSAG